MDSVAGPSPQAVAVRHNLPTFLTSFVDREADLRSLRSLLRSSRLVTLTGTGGAGKSRLAAEAARANSAAWPDGVLWIELADETDVPAAVVARLELPGRGSPDEVVASWLASRRALLILDNCEHVIVQSASFSNLVLRRCPELSILATSREPLGVAGEARWPVSSLGDPDALSLFEARARMVAPEFKLGAHNRGPVVAICERLDRLPLAIEMAASRLDLMSETELLANLNDRFRLLASGARTVPERQQTMVAAIDWSYRLLTDHEARLFRRLAVFHGGFTLEAALTVGANGDPLGLLTGLVKKSMVVADRLEDGSTRYRLLESNHAYALEKLHESGDEDAIRRRHYDYFRTQPWRWRESANFWAALTWARDHVEDAGLALAVELAELEFSDQARVRILLVERLARASDRDAVRARALNVAARLAARQGDFGAGLTLVDESIALAREVGGPYLIANMLRGAGVVYHTAGRLDDARRMYDEALFLLEKSSDLRLAIDIQNQIGIIANERGDFETGLAILHECVAYSRTAGDRLNLSRHLESLANSQMGIADIDAAAASWTESLAIERELNNPLGMVYSLGGLALVAAARKEDDRALRLAAVVDRLSRESSFSTLPQRVEHIAAAVERIRKKLGAARSDPIWTEAQAMSNAAAVEYALSEAQYQAVASADAGPLSRREREVAAMVAAGMTNRQIAEKLFIAERTAEGHVERIRNKLGVRSRTEVATWAVAHGLVSRQP
jgi:predicted ATPase/DNA-binding NarL/FixJ family response regulator